jgi:cytochrome c oxidase subunit 2
MVADMTRRAGFIGAAVLLALLMLAGCAGSPSALDPQSPEARHISGLWWLMFVMAAVVYVIVGGLVLHAMFRRRRSEHVSERFRHRLIVYGGLLIPIAILAVVAVFTVRTTNALVPRAGTVQIDIAGEQWWWRITYPDLGVTTANELHIPVGQRVEVSLTSNDVIHSFWVPQLGGKTDLIPGQVNHVSFTADHAGTYRGQCAEFCGIEHARMAILVIADEPTTFDRWVRDQRHEGAQPSDPLGTRGQQLFVDRACAGCHTVTGTSAAGTLGPDLSHVGSRSTIAAVTLPNTSSNMARWLAHTQGVKPGNRMPQIDLTAGEVDALVAYLETLR